MAVYSYNFDDFDFCDSLLVKLLHNSINGQDSKISKVMPGGFLFSKITELQISGALIIGNTVMSKIAVYSEQLLTVLLNLDVI